MWTCLICRYQGRRLTASDPRCGPPAGKLDPMDISHFNDLLQAARLQSEPQRLLLVFASASLPAGATAEQQAGFDAGESGELAPLMCVDKDPAALADFAALRRSKPPRWARTGPWCSLPPCPAQGGRPPSDSLVDAALQRMVDAVKSGELAGLIPFDRQGEAVQLR